MYVLYMIPYVPLNCVYLKKVFIWYVFCKYLNVQIFQNFKLQFSRVCHCKIKENKRGTHNDYMHASIL